MMMFVNFIIGDDNDKKEEYHKVFGQIYTEHSKKVLEIATKIVKDPDMANDVCQITFTRIWAAIDRICVCKNVKSLIYVAAKNAAITELKKHITECKYTVPLEEVNEETLNSNGPELADIVVSQENIEFIHKKIKELDEKYSSVLLLNLACECSPQTIADILGMNINTVYSRIHIAKNKLKVKLNEYYKEEAK